MKLLSLILLLTMILPGLVVAQKSTHPEATNCDGDYCWGDKREEGKVQFAMYSDNFNFGEYAWEKAEPPLSWLIENIPYLHIGMYINGYKIYKKLEEDATDEARKQDLQDKMLKLFDNRIKYFGDEAENLQRKGTKAYPFLIKRENKPYDELYELYNRIFELNGGDTYSSNMVYLIAMVKIQYKRKKLDDEEVLAHFEKVNQAIENNIDKAKDADEREQWKKVASKIDGILPITDLNIDCDWVKEKMADVIDGSNNDPDRAKKALRYLIQLKCTDESSFLAVAEKVFETEPKASLASILAKKYTAEKSYDKSVEWFTKAIGLTDEPVQKGELQLEKAQILALQGKRSDARSAAMHAVESNDALTSKAYSFIGDLYFSSGSICSDPDPVKSRAIYLAAYDAYQRAGNGQKMAAAKEQFPSAAELHTAGYKVGDSISVGCWIGGSTVLRKRETGQ